MRTLLALLPFLLLACEPPKEVELGTTGSPNTASAEPLIEIIYPPNGTTLTLEDDCSLHTVVAVQIENYDIVLADENPTPAPGEGHWHAQVGGETGYEKIDDGQAVELVREDFPVGDFTITASLVNSQHQPIEEGQNEYLVELTSVEPYGVICN